jgi:nucleotidyltransferase/DNA polymerase involved in DNA repair
MTIGDIAAADERVLRLRLGSAGSHFYRLAHALDPRQVERGRTARSIGSDRTLSADIWRRADLELHLRRAAERIARRLRAREYVASGIRVKLKTSKFQILSRQALLPKPADTAELFFAASRHLLDRFDHPGPFRLVGMAAFGLDWREQPLQTDLFEDGRRRRLETTIDDLVERYGGGIVIRATDLRQSGTVFENGMNLDFLDYRDGERVSRPGATAE